MTTKLITILDPSGNVVARAQVGEEGGRFAGEVDLRLMPRALREKFEEFEEIVNGQMFSFLDEIEEQIAALRLRVVFPGGQESGIEDLQIYPTEQRVSFRLVNAADTHTQSA
jgi:hypothetical protein